MIYSQIYSHFSFYSYFYIFSINLVLFVCFSLASSIFVLQIFGILGKSNSVDEAISVISSPRNEMNENTDIAEFSDQEMEILTSTDFSLITTDFENAQTVSKWAKYLYLFSKLFSIEYDWFYIYDKLVPIEIIFFIYTLYHHNYWQ